MDFLKKLKNKSREYNLVDFSASISFYFFISMFPFLIMLYTIIGFLNIEVESALLPLYELMPRDTVYWVKSFINTSAKETNIQIFSITTLFLLWSSTRGFHSFNNIVNKIFDIKPKGHFLIKRLLAMVYVLFFILVIILNTIIPVLTEYVYDILLLFIKDVPFLVNIFFGWSRFLLSFIMLLSTLTILSFTIKVKKKTMKFKHLFLGSLFSSILMTLVSLLFSLSIEYIFDLSIYGAISTIIIFLMWIFWNANIILIGLEISSILGEQS